MKTLIFILCAIVAFVPSAVSASTSTPWPTWTPLATDTPTATPTATPVPPTATLRPTLTPLAHPPSPTTAPTFIPTLAHPPSPTPAPTNTAIPTLTPIIALSSAQVITRFESAHTGVEGVLPSFGNDFNTPGHGWLYWAQETIDTINQGNLLFVIGGILLATLVIGWLIDQIKNPRL